MPSQFDFYEFYLEYDVELLVGLGVFVLTALVGWFASSRKKLQSRSRHPAASVAYGYGRTPPHGVRPPHVRRPSPQPKGPPADPFEQGGFGEVRAAVRRKGSVVRVAVANAQLEEVEQGWVVDRSTGGLGLYIEGPLAAGTVLNVRPWDAGDVAPWSQVVVRNCYQENGHWKIGCQFVKTPPWSVLLMFG